MSQPDIETLLPPDDPVAFESFCCDLWTEIWGSKASKHGRPGQAQQGVDVFGRTAEGWQGVQCKQKSWQTQRWLTVAEVDEEVEKAREFAGLHRLVIATTGPPDAKVQARARQLDGEQAFQVEVWFWEQALALLDEAWADPKTHVLTFVAGHALTLNLLGNYLKRAHHGDIRRQDRVDFAEANEKQGGHAFRVIEAYEHRRCADEALPGGYRDLPGPILRESRGPARGGRAGAVVWLRPSVGGGRGARSGVGVSADAAEPRCCGPHGRLSTEVLDDA